MIFIVFKFWRIWGDSPVGASR